MGITIPFRIMDEDHYFADGLRQVLQSWDLDVPVADTAPRLVFFTPETRKQLSLTLFTSPSPDIRLVCIASKRVFPRDSCPGFPGIPVLHREEMPVASWLYQLLEPVGSKSLLSPLTLLSRREQEVLGFLTHQRPREAGKIMRISEKTVSNYKRQAMLKLGLASTEGIRQWMGAFGEVLHRIDNPIYQCKSCISHRCSDRYTTPSLSETEIDISI